MVDSKLPKVYVVGKDKGENTGVYINGKLVDTAKKVIITIEAGEVNKAILVFSDVKFYWKNGKWNRDIVERRIEGLIGNINQGISLLEKDFKEIGRIQKRFENWEKSFEKK